MNRRLRKRRNIAIKQIARADAPRRSAADARPPNAWRCGGRALAGEVAGICPWTWARALGSGLGAVRVLTGMPGG